MTAWEIPLGTGLISLKKLDIKISILIKKVMGKNICYYAVWLLVIVGKNPLAYICNLEFIFYIKNTPIFIFN